MAFHYNPKIVTDGLVFGWDGMNPKCWDGVSNTHYELVGGGSGTKNGNIFQIKVNDDMKIIYHMKNKFIKNDLKKFLSTIEKDEDYKHIIFIFKEKINNNNEKNIKELLEGVTYELFPIKNLLFNITKHSYVPKHELLSVDEANNIMKIYSIKNKSQFPIILKSDPVARYYDFKPGQLIKVYRSSTATGESITYRYCV